jgi:hypothetical protein
MAARAPAPRRDPNERSFDMRSLLRLALWGAAAAICLGGVVVAAYTNVGSQRLMLAFAPSSGPTTAQLAARSIETENETRRVAAAVQSLNAERERLLTRITSLERGLQDITGSIQRQAASTGVINPPPAEVTPSSTAVESPSEQPAPPNHVVALSADQEGRAAIKAKLEFGVDIGTAANFDGLRLLWNSIHGANPALFEGLRPVVMVRENRRTRAAELRLLVGPFVDAEAAARLCSTLAASRRSCQPTPFEGQQFSLATEPESRSTRRPTSMPASKTPRQNPQQKSPAE